MATEAGITEVLLPTKGEGEAVSLMPVQFEKTVSESFVMELRKCEESELKYLETETRESLAESEENMQVVSSTHVEVVKDVVSNSGTLEDASFLASDSGPTVTNEEPRRPEDYQVDKLHPLETVISEDEKHLEKVQQYGVLDEIVYEVDQNGKNHDVQSTIEASAVVKGGETKLGVEADEAMKDEINLHRNVEVNLTQQDSVDEGTRSTEEETRDFEKDERGKTEDSQAELASKESPCEEATLDENIESTSSKEATLSKEEYTDQQSFEETKEEDKCIEVVTEEKVSEANFSSVNVETDKEKDKITDGSIEDASKSIISLSRESPHNETGVAVKDDERESVTDEVGEQAVSVKPIQEEELKELESTKHEEQPKDCLLPQNEPEDQLQTDVVISEEAKRGDNEIVTSIKEDGGVKNLEESFKEGETNAISDSKGIEAPSEEIVTRPLIHSDKKDESTEAELTNADAGDLHAANFLVEQVEAQGGKTDEALEMKSVEKDKKSDGLEKEEKHVADEADKEIPEEVVSKLRAQDEIHEQKSTEADVKKEQITEGDVACFVPESIREESIKRLEENVKDSEKLTAEDYSAEIIKEGNANELSPETIQDATKTIEGHEHEAEKSNNEVLEELEIAEAKESISCKKNKDIESVVDESLVKEEEGKSLDSVESSTEEQRVEILEEETMKSRHEGESCALESTEGNVNKEQIVDRDITFSTSESASKSSQEIEKDAEKLDEEESTTEIVKEANVNDLLQENVREDANKTLFDYNDEAETSKYKVVKELEITGARESIPCKTDKEVESFVAASSVKQDEGHQEEGKDVGSTKASTEDNNVEILEEVASESRGEDESHGQSAGADFDKENTTEEVTVSNPDLIQEETSKSSQDDVKGAEKISEESTEEVIKENNANDLSPENIQENVIEKIEHHENKVESCKEKVVEEMEIGQGDSIQYETNEESERSVDASVVKQEESQQEEGKHEDPIEISIEENKVEIPKDEPVTSRGEDERNGQSIEAESKKEQIIQEEIESSQDTVKDEEKKIEEIIAESIQEGNVANFSQENIREDATEKSKDHEDIAEKCKEEVVQELETPREVEIISCETNKYAESSTDASSVKLDESQQKEDKYLDQVEVPKDDNKVDGTFSTDIVNDDDNTFKATERGTELAAEGEEDKQQATQNDKPDEKLENLVHVTPEQTETESSENSVSFSCITVQETIENLQETSETVKENADTTNDSEKEIRKESEATEINESIPCKTDEEVVERSVVEEEQIETKGHDTEEENKVEDKECTEVVTEDAEQAVKVTDEGVEVAYKGEEDQPQGTPNDKTEEMLENLVHGTPDKTETESSENAGYVTCIDVHEATENLETSEMVQTKNKDVENDSEKEIPKESDSAELNESIPCKTNEDVVERPAVASSVKQEEEQQEREGQDPEEESKVEEKKSTEVVKEGDVDVVKLREESTYKGEEDEENVVQNDRPDEMLENLVHGTPEQTEIKSSEYAGNEIPKESEAAEPSESIPCKTNEDVVERSVVTSSLKQEDPEEENKVEDKSSTEVVKEGDENAVNVTEEDEENQQKFTQNDKTDEMPENLVHGTPEQTGIESSENAGNEIPKESEADEPNLSIPCKTNEDVVETSVVTSLEKQEEEKKESEGQDLEAASGEDYKVEDEKTNVVKEDDENTIKVTEEVVEVARKGEGDQQHAIKEDEPVEKLEDAPHATPEESKMESSIQTNIASREVEGTTQNTEETSYAEKTENIDNANDSTKAVAEELEIVEASESSPCETEEKKVEDTLSTTAVDDYDDNKVEATERTIDVSAKAEEDEKQATQKDEPVEKIQVTPEETPTEPSSAHVLNNTCIEVEGTAQNLEEISETENKEEKAKNADNVNESEKEVIEITSASQENKEQVSREINFAEEFQQKYANTETEDTKEYQESTAVGEQGITEPSSLTIQEEKIEESSKELDKEEGTESEGKEQKITDFVEEIKSESLEDSAKPNEDSCTTTTAEAPKEEKVAEETKDKPDNEDQIRSCEIESEEMSVKEVKPDEEEKTGVSDAAPEEKDLSSSVDVGLQSDHDSTTLASEETSLKNAKPENEEQIKSCDVAPKDEGLASYVIVDAQPDSVMSRYASEETSLEEAEPSKEEQVNSSKIAPEKDLSSSVDAGLESDSVSTTIASEQTLQAELSKEELVKSSDIAAEEKDLSNSVDAGLVSTTIASEEASLKEAEPETREQIRSRDKGPASSVVVDTQPDYVSTRLVSEQLSLEEAELSKEEQVKSSDIAPEKDLSSSVDAGLQSDSVSTTVASEETLQAELSKEGLVRSYDIAAEEKDLSSSVDAGLVSTTIASEETSLKEAEPETEEQIRSRDFTPEDKSLASRVVVDTQPDSVSTRLASEETSLEEAELSKEEQVRSSDFAPEEKSQEIEVQSDSVPTETVSAETCVQDAEQGDNQVKVSDIAPEEKSLLSSEDTDVQYYSVSTASVNEEKKEVKEDEEEQVTTRDFASEKKDLPSNVDVEVPFDSLSTEILSKETDLKDEKHDHDEQVDSSNISLEEKVLESSLDTGSVIEERSLMEVDPDNEEQIIDIAAEKKSLASRVDVEVQSDSVSAEIQSEETCLKEDKPKDDSVESSDVTSEEASSGRNIDIDVQSNSISAEVGSEETALKEAEPDYKEQVNYSDIAPEEKVPATNGDDDVVQKGLKLEEDEENKIPAITGEIEEKVEREIDETDTKEKQTTTETPLDYSPEDDLKDSPTIPSIEHGPVTIEASERSDETTALDKPQCEYEKLPTNEAEKEEELLQLKDDSRLESLDTEKEIASEETKEQELNIPPEIIPEDVTPTEVHGDTEKDDETGNAKEHVADGESITREFHPVCSEDERTYEEKDSSAVLTEVIKATDSDEHTLGTDSQAEKSATEKNEEFAATESVPEEEKLNDEGTKPVDVCVALPEEGKIEEETKPDTGNKSDGIDTTTGVDKTTLTMLTEAQLVDEPVKPFDEAESVKVEERSFDLVSEQPIDQKDSERENITVEKCTASEVEETKLAPDTEDNDATSPIPTAEELKTEETKDETKKAFEYKSVGIQEDDMKISQAPDGISKEQLQLPACTLAPENKEHETETTVETKEDPAKEVDYQDNAKTEAKLHAAAEERLQKDEAEEDIKRAPEAAVVSNYESMQEEKNDEIAADRDLPIGIPTEPVQVSSSTLLAEAETETTSIVKKTEEETEEEQEVLDTKKIEESLATEVSEESKFKEEIEEDITKAPVEVSSCNVESIEEATKEEIVEKQAVQKLPPEEADSATIDEENRTEVMVPDNSTRDYSPINEGTKETEETKVSVEAEEEKKDTSTTVSESYPQSTETATEEKTITPKEQDDESTTTEKEIEEREKPKELSYENTEKPLEKTEEEPRELREFLSPVEVLVAYKVEGVIEASETVSKESSLEKEVISRDISTCQAVQFDKDEIVSETVSTIEKVEEDTKGAKLPYGEVCLDLEEPKKLEVSELGRHASDFVQEGLKEVPKVEGREDEDYTRHADPEPENDKATETRETVVEARSLHIDSCELTSDFVAEKVESPEPLTSIEDVEIIENHLKIAATDLGTEETQPEKTTEAEKWTAQEISHKEELSTDTAQEKRSPNIEEAHEISRDFNLPEESFNVTCEERTPTEVETKVTTRDVETPRKLAEPTEEASPRDHTDREIKGEQEAPPALISLSELMQDSKEETKPKAENLSEETEEPKRSKDTENEKAKTDEEKDEDEEEHEEDEEHEESEHPDAPILVQSSKDIDAKASRKKSHGLFSGVGSKVKHSISKVKKAITGKSTHSKTQHSSS